MIDVLDQNINYEVNNVFSVLRLGVFLMVVLLGIDLLLGQFFNEFFIYLSVEPIINLCLMELVPLGLIIMFLPWTIKQVNTALKKGNGGINNMLRNLTLLFVLTIFLYLINDFYIIHHLPLIYSINAKYFDDYIFENKEHSWIYYLSFVMFCSILGYYLKQTSAHFQNQ